MIVKTKGFEIFVKYMFWGSVSTKCVFSLQNVSAWRENYPINVHEYKETNKTNKQNKYKETQHFLEILTKS